MSLEWSKEKTEALVSLYQQNQCLYDPSHYFYRDRNERKKTISYIATVLQTSENSITSKIKNIRSQLWRERWKEQYRELNGTEDRGKWWLKDSLQFLEPFLVLKSSTCCLQLDDGQTLQTEVSAGSGSDKDFIHASNVDFTYNNNTKMELQPTVVTDHNVNRIDLQRNITSTDLPRPHLQTNNPMNDQPLIKDQQDGPKNNQISGEDSHHPVEFNHLEEINKIKDNIPEDMEEESCTETRNDSLRLIQNYPTGIFRNDYMFDSRNQKARYKQADLRGQRTVEKSNNKKINTTVGRSQSIIENLANCGQYTNSDSNTILIEDERISGEHSLRSASNGSHSGQLNQPTTHVVGSQRIPAAENVPSLGRNCQDYPRTSQKKLLPRNSMKRVVGKYKVKTDTIRHKKSKRSWINSDDDFESNCNEGHLVIQAVSCLERVSNRLAVEDQFSVFGKHVANELRSVTSLDAQRWARMKIQNILYEAQTFVNPSNSRGVTNANISENRHSSTTSNGTVQSTSID